MFSKYVRDQIDQQYDLGKQRVAKRDAASGNPLIVDPAGTVNGRLIYHLDDSPRLYTSLVTRSIVKEDEDGDGDDDGATYEVEELTWGTLTVTTDAYERFIDSLPEPDRVAQQAREEALEALAQATQYENDVTQRLVACQRTAAATATAAAAAAAPAQLTASGKKSKAKPKPVPEVVALVQDQAEAQAQVRTALKSLTRPQQVWDEMSQAQMCRYELERELDDVVEFQKVGFSRGLQCARFID